MFYGLAVIRNTTAFNQGSGDWWNVGDIQTWNGATVECLENVGYANAYGVYWATNNATGVSCNDWFGNQGGDVAGAPPSPTDFSVNPLFCDEVHNDFHLLATSPLVNAGECGQIGALGVGCGVTATMVLRFDAQRTADGIRIAWQLSDANAQAWLERSEAGPDGPWSRPATNRARDGATAIELDQSAQAARPYWYRLVELQDSVPTAIGAPILVEAAPLTFALSPLKPNPSMGQAKIEFILARPAEIRIDVYDLQGRIVATPAQGAWPAGRHAVQWLGDAAGVYLVRYRYPGGHQDRRLIRIQ